MRFIPQNARAGAEVAVPGGERDDGEEERQEKPRNRSEDRPLHKNRERRGGNHLYIGCL